METVFSGFSGKPDEYFLFRHLTTNYSHMGTYHRHDGYEVYLFLQGNVNCYVEQQCFHLERGDLLVIRPGEYHRPHLLDNSNYERITFNFSASLLQHLSTNQSNLADFFQTRPANKVCFAHLNEEQLTEYLFFIQELETQKDCPTFGADLLVHSRITQLFVLINRVFRTEANPTANIMPKLIRDLLRYIDTNLSEKITLETLEQTFYLDGTYISRQFKKHTGLTLRSYLLERRISRACTLLASDLSITEVCHQAGFSDYANFIRSFTKATGISPGKYAKQIK